MKKNILFLYVILFTLAGCDINRDTDVAKPKLNITYGTYTDTRDKCTYNTITIGNQTWMVENLRYLPSVNQENDFSTYQARYYVYGYSGTSISEAMKTTVTQTGTGMAGENTFYHFGVLYNQTAAATAPPKGWRLPTKDDYEQLRKYVAAFYTGDQYGYATALLDKRVANMPLVTWDSEYDSNSLRYAPFFGNTGLNFMPAGFNDGTYYSPFEDIGHEGYYWVQDRYGSPGAYIKLTNFVKPTNWFYSSSYDSYDAYSIRCIMQ